MIKTTICRECERPIPYAGNGRPRVTCSDDCRDADRAKPWFLRKAPDELPKGEGKPNRPAPRPGLAEVFAENTERERLRARHAAGKATDPDAEIREAEQASLEAFEDYLSDLSDLPAWMPVNARGFMSRAAFLAAYYEEFGEDDAPRPQDLYAALVNDDLFSHTKLRGVRGFRAIPDDEDTE